MKGYTFDIFDNKFILFGTFADNYKRHQRSSLRTNRQWFENVDQWLIEKFILIRALEDMIYTHKYAFLPCDCSKTECKEDPVEKDEDVAVIGKKIQSA